MKRKGENDNDKKKNRQEKGKKEGRFQTVNEMGKRKNKSRLMNETFEDVFGRRSFLFYLVYG